MSRRKTLKELTIKDPFMFAAVMSREGNCRELLELILGIPLARIDVIAEKTMVYHPAFHGVRLDVYARDDINRRFDIEMQIATTSIEKRTRYYHSQIDMDLLKTGHPYEELSETYVIFICDYDPFGDGKYCYTVQQILKENGADYDDGRHSVFLSTVGTHPEEVPKELVNFLKYVHADLESSMIPANDDYVRRLQSTVAEVKNNREMEDRYMLFEDMLNAERREGHKEGLKEGSRQAQQDSILLLLAQKGEIPVKLEDIIRATENTEQLKRYLLLASQAESVSDFESHL